VGPPGSRREARRTHRPVSGKGAVEGR